jgi:hypothetical protein
MIYWSVHTFYGSTFLCIKWNFSLGSLQPWTWRQYNPLNSWYPPTRQYGTLGHTPNRIFAAVKTPSVTHHTHLELPGTDVTLRQQTRAFFRKLVPLTGLQVAHSISWASLKKLTVTQLVKKFPPFYGTRWFITVFTRARHWSISWAR